MTPFLGFLAFGITLLVAPVARAKGKSGTEAIWCPLPENHAVHFWQNKICSWIISGVKWELFVCLKIGYPSPKWWCQRKIHIIKWEFMGFRQTQLTKNSSAMRSSDISVPRQTCMKNCQDLMDLDPFPPRLAFRPGSVTYVRICAMPFRWGNLKPAVDPPAQRCQGR